MEKKDQKNENNHALLTFIKKKTSKIPNQKKKVKKEKSKKKKKKIKLSKQKKKFKNYEKN